MARKIARTKLVKKHFDVEVISEVRENEITVQFITKKTSKLFTNLVKFLCCTQTNSARMKIFLLWLNFYVYFCAKHVIARRHTSMERYKQQYIVK